MYKPLLKTSRPSWNQMSEQEAECLIRISHLINLNGWIHFLVFGLLCLESGDWSLEFGGWKLESGIWIFRVWRFIKLASGKLTNQLIWINVKPSLSFQSILKKSFHLWIQFPFRIANPHLPNGNLQLHLSDFHHKPFLLYIIIAVAMHHAAFIVGFKQNRSYRI